MKVSIGTYPNRNEEREISVQIDKWDTWSLDHTLSLIILPALIKFKTTKHSYAKVDREDVPFDMEFDEYGYSEEAWDWVLDQMIDSFQIIHDDKKSDIEIGQHARLQNGLRLFGKYYCGLWD